ncbi:10335_t:CDS:2 [Funneliformis mosseae]|uniref:10335_t:CDS:1 n=1 Tax=Funneliformis mosseae TaxID=27381 RepID=A0A9N9E1H1_FUNMO|nr:10335_t:CDS:2 [Funneliformis mosseae]
MNRARGRTSWFWCEVRRDFVDRISQVNYMPYYIKLFQTTHQLYFTIYFSTKIALFNQLYNLKLISNSILYMELNFKNQYHPSDLAFFPHELHMVKDDSIIATISTNETQMKVHFGFDLTFEQLIEQENKEKIKMKDEEYGDAMDYVESYFDNGEADDAFDDDGGGGEAYFD